MTDSNTEHPDASASPGGTDPSIPWNNLKEIGKDRSIPPPVRLTWEPFVPEGTAIRYEFLISRSPDFRDAFRRDGLEECRVDLYNLHLDTAYVWKVRALDEGRPVAESELFRFRTQAAPPRWIRVPGISNVRDLGGWTLPGGRRIVQGRVYRSSEMNAHFEIQPEGRRVLEEELGLRCVLDLRGGDEPTAPVLDPTRVRYVNVPVKPYADIATEEGMRAYREVFGVIADPDNHPLVFHCWGGCDRGGTVAFLLHALLGLERDRLFHDYELSSLSIWGERNRDSENVQSLLTSLVPFGGGKDCIRTQVEGYLRHIGLARRDIDRIRSLLTESLPD